MDAETTCLVIVLFLLCLILEIQAQKKGFRGGSKSYEIHVEANSVGTNLHYELPESKVKATSKEDWQVDNDNAEMFAMNSPILATVNVKHPKFSMKGQWPEYKTSFKLPKDVSVASKRADFSKLFKIKTKVRKTDPDQSDEESSAGNEKASRNPLADEKPSGSGIKLKNLVGRLFSGRKPGKKKSHDEGMEMSQITRLILPITGMKNVNLSNPRVSSAMKGVIKHARKVVDEAKAVLNDAANFVTKVRKLVKVTKDHSKIHRQLHKVIAMKTSSTKHNEGNLNSVTPNAETPSSSKDREKTESVRLKEVVGSEERQNELNHAKASMQRIVHGHAHNDKAKTPGRGENKARTGMSAKGVEKRSFLDFKDIAEPRKLERKPRVHRRGLAETLESILSTINDLQGLSKYK